MINLDSILKSRDITLPTKVHLVKAMVFPVVMYGCESWTVKKAEHWRIDAFELWCWRRLLWFCSTARRRKSVLNTHWKGWCWSWNSSTLATWWEELTHWKRPWCWERLKAGGKGTAEDEMAGWHHWLDGHEFEQALWVGTIEICLVSSPSRPTPPWFKAYLIMHKVASMSLTFHSHTLRSPKAQPCWKTKLLVLV